MEAMKTKNISCDDVGIEESCIMLESLVDHPVTFQYQSMECDQCDFVNGKRLLAHHVENVTLNYVSFGTEWRVLNETNGTVCSHEDTFEESSWYTLHILNGSDCLLQQTKHVPSPYIPVAVAFAVLLILSLVWKLYTYLYRNRAWERLPCCRSSVNFNAELAAAYSGSSSTDHMPKQAKERLRSLDTVRGMAVVIMIFVNYGGGKYWFFHHSRWNGLTVADLVFPWFIWMMGLSLALFLRSQFRRKVPRRTIFLNIVRRSSILFLLGLMLNTYCSDVEMKNIRISGVLQRFGISYFVVASLHLLCFQPDDNSGYSLILVKDISVYWIEWLVMIAILMIHILITFLVSSPGCPRGYLGPGGLHHGGNYSLCTGGAAGYIDRIILGENHLYQRPTFKDIYKTTLPYDPEGLLGYLTSIFLVFLGLQAGKILIMYQSNKARLIRWFCWGIIMGLLATLLSKGSENEGWIPINKNLWSVSFIFATGSQAFILMTICYYIIDIKHWWSGIPFFYAGMNSILLYVGHEMTHNMFPWSWKVPHTHASQLALDMWGTFLWILIAAWAHHIQFYVTV